jgi:6-phosphogluconolactonase (cycloisomerase 2 family)
MIGMKSISHWIKRWLIALSLLAPLLASPAGAVMAAGNYDNGAPGAGAPGAVFTLTNSAGGNEVIAFQRGSGGSLISAGAYATGGLGSGAGLGSQGSLALSADHHWLLAVNAGSHEISLFEVSNGGLRLTDKLDSGGLNPISLAIYKQLVYVLNGGGSGNITGFKLSRQGRLHPIPNSTRTLSNGGSGQSTGPAQISFTPDGRSLVVTEKATNQILIYRLSKGGFEGPSVHASAGQTPFGFGFAGRNTLIISEAFGGAPGASAASSYAISGGGLQLISGSALTYQTAACWVAVTHNGRFAYTTNTGSSSITGYQVGSDGSLALLDEDGFTAFTGDGSRPIDMAFSRDNRYLYALSTGSSTISAYAVQANGSLAASGPVSVPAGSVGLAAY